MNKNNKWYAFLKNYINGNKHSNKKQSFYVLNI